MKIAIIGSKDHFGAKCFEWLEFFPNLEEFDKIIIDLSSLDQSLLNKFIEKKGIEFQTYSEQLLTVFSTGREIFCIINDIMFESQPQEIRYSLVGKISNYNFLFVRPSLVRSEGDSRTACDERFKPYFDKVGNWRFEISNSYDVVTKGSGTTLSSIGKAEPIAINKSNKAFATKIISREAKTGALYFLPPVTKCSQKEGIDILLGMISEVAVTPKPVWWEEIDFPNHSEIKKQIKDIEEGITELEKKKIELETDLSNLEEYGNLLTTNGDKLVLIVKRVLADLGIDTKLTEAGFVVDLINEKNIAIEVTGTTDKIDSDSDKIFQITKFKEKFHKGEKIILIANTYRMESPSKRENKLHFTKEVLDFLKLKRVCCVSTGVLWKYWKAVLTNSIKAKDFQAKIFETDGELTF